MKSLAEISKLPSSSFWN